MPWLGDLLLLLILPLLLIVSGFVSGSETALFSLSSHQRLQLARSGTLAGSAVQKLLSETRQLLITLLLSNMVVNVLYFIISTVLLLRLKERTSAWVVAACSVAPLLLVILFGEVLPKVVAARLPTVWCRFAAVPLLLVHRAIAPLRSVLSTGVVAPLARLIAPSKQPPELSADELEALLKSSEGRGVIDAEEERMLQQVLELGQLKVRHLMTPRIDVRAFNLRDDPRVLIDLLRSTRLSQLPVYRGDVDHIEGMLYARDVLLSPSKSREQVLKLVREVSFVPEAQRADQLLVHLRKKGATLAIVVDEYGGTAGIVTLEDVIEHMVGEIAGPFEPAAGHEVELVEPGVWRANGQLAVRDWAQAFKALSPTRFGQGSTDVSTIGGLIMMQLGRLPRPGDVIQFNNVSIEVQSMKGSRVDSVLVRLRRKGKEKSAAASAH